MTFQISKALKFIISGGMAAFSKLLFFIIFFYFFNIYYLLASGIAFTLSVVVGFYLQKHFTFEDKSKENTKKQAFIFAFVSLLNLLVNIAAMYLFVIIFKWNEIFSQVLVIGIIALWNFFVYQKFVFNNGKLTPL